MIRSATAKAFVTAVLVVGGSSRDAAAQGSSAVEQHLYSHVQMLRLQLLEQSLAASPERRAAAARALADDDGAPLQPLGQAFAALRSDEPLSPVGERLIGFLPLVLPTLISQDGEETSVHTTLNMPRVPTGEVASTLRMAWVDIDVFDPDGALIGTETIAQNVERDDLLRFATTRRLETTEWMAGTYRVRLRPRFHGMTPGEVDRAEILPLESLVHVVPGYRDRAAKFFVGTRSGLPSIEVPETATAVDRAVLRGALQSVARVWRGEPRLAGHDPVLDLAVLEQVHASLVRGDSAVSALAALLAKSDADDGSTRGVTLAVPIAENEDLRVRVDTEFLADASSADRPVVCVLPGTPTWSLSRLRPSRVRTVDPAWPFEMCRRGGLLGSDAALHLVTLESAGSVGNVADAVAKVVETVPGWRPGAGEDAELPPLVLVGEREGAFQICLALRKHPDLARVVRGLVLVDGGLFDEALVEQVGEGFPVLYVGPGDELGTERAQSFFERGNALGLKMHLHLENEAPWPVALGLAGPAIRDWIEGVVVGDRADDRDDASTDEGGR